MKPISKILYEKIVKLNDIIYDVTEKINEDEEKGLCKKDNETAFGFDVNYDNNGSYGCYYISKVTKFSIKKIKEEYEILQESFEPGPNLSEDLEEKVWGYILHDLVVREIVREIYEIISRPNYNDKVLDEAWKLFEVSKIMKS